MEQVQKKGAAVEELGGNFSTVLSSSILHKIEKELEKRGMLFTPELSKQLRKFIVESYDEIQSSRPSTLIEDVGTATPSPISEQLVEGTLPPLVFQVDYDCLVMGMMIDGKPEVVKNEKGSRSTPAYSGLTDDNRLVYGTDAKMHHDLRARRYDVWSSLKRGGPNQTFNFKEFEVFGLPGLFFPALLIRKLKITAEESQCDGELGQFQAAILAVPMETTSADRLHLKEAAQFAGFQNAYVISAEGLAAYYWFHKNEMERKQNNYSKDFVIINWTWTVVVYKRSSVAGTDGKKCLAVTPIVSIHSQCGRPSKAIEFEFFAVLRTLLKLDKNAVIPIVGNCDREIWYTYCQQSLDKNKIKKVEEDKSDPSDYFAAKGAALLSGIPENLGLQVRSMMETVSIEPSNNKLPGTLITRHDQILPETFAQRTFTLKHVRTKYRIRQRYEIVGYLVINEVELGSDLQVTYTLSWEGIVKVVGVSSKQTTDDDVDYKAVSWEWLNSDKVNVPQFGNRSYEECKSLLLKFAPSPSRAKMASTQGDSSGGLPPQTLNEAAGNGKGKMLATKSRVTLPNDMNRFKDQDKLLNKALSSPSQVKRRSARLTKVGVTTAGLGNSQDQSVGLGSSTIDSGDGNGMQEKKRRRKGRVLCTNDIIVNPHLKKIKLESDWGEPVLKIEQDLVDDFREDGNGQQVNFVEQEEEIKIEEDVVKIEAEGGGENTTD